MNHLLLSLSLLLSVQVFLVNAGASCHSLPLSLCKESCYCGRCNDTVCVSVNKHGQPKHHYCQTLQTNYHKIQCQFYFDSSGDSNSSSDGISDRAVAVAVIAFSLVVIVSLICLIRMLCCVHSGVKGCFECCCGKSSSVRRY